MVLETTQTYFSSHPQPNNKRSYKKGPVSSIMYRLFFVDALMPVWRPISIKVNYAGYKVCASYINQET